jgi:hypothetical protein
MSSTVAACVARVRRPVTALVLVILLAACDGGGSGQSGSAFTFLSVDSFSTSGSTPTATVNSSIDTGTSTTACVTLRNNQKNPTVSMPNALDNVTIQSYTVTLTAADGGSLPGPFTFGTAVLIPAAVTTGTTTTTTTDNFQTFPVILVPASAKNDPRIRPPRTLPLIATAEVTFQGRDGRGSSVKAEGAVTVVFVTGGSDSACATAGGATTGGGGTGGTGGTGTTTMQIRRR